MNARLIKIIKDFGSNILASLIVTATLQILAYPILASIYTSEEYGKILTIMGIVNTLVVSFGNSLNNVRLILNNVYTELKDTSDFNRLLLLSITVSNIIVITAMTIIKINNITLISLLILVSLGILRAYYVFNYRLRLDFVKNLICSTLISLGYIIGILLIKVIEWWFLLFIIGESLALIYTFKYNNDKVRSIKKSKYYRSTFNKYALLIGTSIIGNLLTYMDRLIIFPSLGGNAVSNYFVASFFGKSLSLIITPVAGVLLGYYVQKNFVMSRKIFWKINFFVICIASIFLVISIFISPWITGLLYPTLIGSAKDYIFLANLAAVIYTTASMTQPAVLKFAPSYWQLVLQIFYGAIYLSLSIILLNNYGLYGFCYSAIISNLLLLIMLYFVGDTSIRKANLNKS